jgi:AraC-like DNA-binding protein
MTQHSSDMIGVFPPGREVEGFKPPGYEQAVITVPVDLFRSFSEVCFPQIPRRVLVSGGVVSLGCRDSGRIRHLVADLLGAADDPASQLVRPEALVALEDDLLTAFMDALTNSPQWTGASPGPRMTARYGLLRRALDLIECAPGDRLQSELLCLELGRSRRCIEYLFRDLLGVSPGSYIRQTRLNAARRALLSSDPGQGLVKEAALDAGFWHLGKFAAHYRKLFGESPSQTLQRPVL